LRPAAGPRPSGPSSSPSPPASAPASRAAAVCAKHEAVPRPPHPARASSRAPIPAPPLAFPPAGALAFPPAGALAFAQTLAVAEALAVALAVASAATACAAPTNRPPAAMQPPSSEPTSAPAPTPTPETETETNVASAPAQLTRNTYHSRDTNSERDYFVYLPAGYDAGGTQRWPLLLVLQGDGERGDAKADLDYLLKNGPLYEAWIQKRELPFVIVAPQLPLYGRDQTVGYLEARTRAEIPQRLAEGAPPRPDAFPTPTPLGGAVSDPDLPYGPEAPP